jgi:hypothetical protein
MSFDAVLIDGRAGDTSRVRLGSRSLACRSGTPWAKGPASLCHLRRTEHPTARGVAQTAQTARTGKASIKWASDRCRDAPVQTAGTAETTLRSRRQRPAPSGPAEIATNAGSRKTSRKRASDDRLEPLPTNAANAENQIGWHCMSETAGSGDLDRRSTQGASSGNCGNAQIGKSVEKSGSQGRSVRSVANGANCGNAFVAAGARVSRREP